ncbi:MAG TPA: ECF transporter S component [Nocardioidaceae bacterium]|nr:ECF transporter S component [Nocardioidaceae bacterium]
MTSLDLPQAGTGPEPGDSPEARSRRGPAPVLPVSLPSAALLTVVSLVGVAAYGWPFLLRTGATTASHSTDAPWVFVALLPLLVLVVLAELSSGGIDAKAVAMLGMLTAVGAALRALGPGAVGLEPSFIVVVIGGRVFGRGFGFVLGALSMFAGALLTGGVGPWLPFQMLGAAWVGLLAGMLPARTRGRAEVLMLAGFGFVAGLFYGGLLNLWFWPFGAYSPETSYVAGAPAAANLHHYLVFWATTSLGWDIPRGLLTAVAVLIMGRPVLAALRRVARRAHFASA